MAACEKCWGDAYSRHMAMPYHSQADHYHRLLAEREGNPCTPRQQAGEWWDGERDTRVIVPIEPPGGE